MSCTSAQADSRVVHRRPQLFGLRGTLTPSLGDEASPVPKAVLVRSISISSTASLGSGSGAVSTDGDDDSGYTTPSLTPHSGATLFSMQDPGEASDEVAVPWLRSRTPSPERTYTAVTEWPRSRTPSPERTYASVTGRTQPLVPPPCMYWAPVNYVPAALNMAITSAPMVAAEPTPAAPQAAQLPASSDSVSPEEDEECMAVKPSKSNKSLPRHASWADQCEEDDEEEPLGIWVEAREAASAAPCGAPDVQQLPSVGASDHGTGKCRPCAHVWKAGGCTKGKDCTYCHSCGHDDFLAYKREYKIARAIAKHEMRRQKEEAAANAEAQDDSEVASSQPPRLSASRVSTCMSCSSSEAVGPIELELESAQTALGPACASLIPSVGSANHGNGACRPCAHVWRRGGCLKGAACTFCHYCGEAESLRIRGLRKAQQEQPRPLPR